MMTEKEKFRFAQRLGAECFDFGDVPELVQKHYPNTDDWTESNDTMSTILYNLLTTDIEYNFLMPQNNVNVPMPECKPYKKSIAIDIVINMIDTIIKDSQHLPSGYLGGLFLLKDKLQEIK